MGGGLVAADANGAGHGLTSYNVSLNLSSFGSFFSLPRFLGLMRKVDGAMDISAMLEDAEAAQAHAVVDPRPPPPHLHAFPGPWAFFSSGYMLGLLLMAVLMHRIPNIVVPPRAALARHFRPAHRRTFLRRIYNFFLPLDPSKMTTRLAIHLPTLYLMCRVLLLWTLILLQASDLYPRYTSGLFHRLGSWSEKLPIQELCWQTFCSICAAFCVEGLTRGLEGVGFGIGAHMHANTSPFNLVGYAFLLHIYSSPITHVTKPEGLPSRPDKHVVFTIALPLLQLTVFHFLSIHKRWCTHRLLPTALTSFLSLLHFHLTIYAHKGVPPALGALESFLPPNATSATRARLQAENAGIYSSYASPTGTSSYPLLNYVPNIFETILLSTILLTVFLNALTQLLLTGEVTKPLLGLGLDGGVSWEEDFGIVLLRVGTASLEATGLRGWSNEVGGIALPGRRALEQAQQRREDESGRLRMNRMGVVSITASKTKKRRKQGLRNEVTDVEVANADLGFEGGVIGIPRVLSVEMRWVRALWAFIRSGWSVSSGVLRLVWDYMNGRGWKRQVVPPMRRGDHRRDEEVEERVNNDAEDELYDRFVRGEEVSDDDAEYSGESEKDESEEETDGADDDGEALDLFRDLQQRETTPTRILAHMITEEGSPLTRRRYSSRLKGPEASSPPASPPRSSPRPLTPSADDETRRNCIICTCEPRSIICWPCRCLTMCDTCRESLASQASASKHRCPCCRRTVEGYSRIFIP